ncbi:pilus assembly protein TadG-related protein [Sinomonas sp. JGH33]|uniref:Pilus assembly protein TadG-related protein n=1 Tax=Sinomonas terricola TaxID=3110330 RepID=A0ABU5T1A1_9MICC|nr:pilus assembly protein TadG-related protein [Sinomonas sp. JGH33]MEA5453435.1 pilus assembly protein TadG-related protein [Sinomonas sp. JGH33]
MRYAKSQYDGGAHRERGAVAVVTVLLLFVLLGAAALAVDGGMLYGKRAQLQSGADAAAIAVAQKCAKSLTDPDCVSTSTLATSLAQSNMAAKQAGIASLAINTTAQTVTATTQPLQPGMQPGSVSLFLAQTIGIRSAALGATAQAAWGSPSTGIAPFPLTFSVCQVVGQVDGGAQLLQDHGSGANPSCNYGPSGLVVPGGFGWLAQNPGQCGATINIALAEGGSAPGSSPPANCDAVFQQWYTTLQSGQNPVVLLPVFTAVVGTGTGAIYTLAGFAAYKVIGWKFSGGNSSSTPPQYVYNNDPSTVDKSLWCDGNCRGIIGQFVTYVTLDNTYQVGPSTPFGATIVRLTQ